MEPHAIDNFGHVACPIHLVHSLYLLLCQHLFVHATSLLIGLVVMKFAGFVVQRFIEGGRENFIHVLDIGYQIRLTWRLRSYCLFRLKWFKQSWLFGRSLKFYDLVEVKNLVVIDGSTDRS